MTKFVQIFRNEEYKNSYTTVRAAEHMLRVGSIGGFSPIALKEIKRQGLHHYRESDYFRHIAENEFTTKYNGKCFKATVVAWNGIEGLVKIHDTDLMLQTIYACNIKGAKTWYPETACVSYNEGQTIDIQLSVFTGFVLFVNGITPGEFDAAKWNSLDQSRLAFKCDENGAALNGLFG